MVRTAQHDRIRGYQVWVVACAVGLDDQVTHQDADRVGGFVGDGPRDEVELRMGRDPPSVRCRCSVSKVTDALRPRVEEIGQGPSVGSDAETPGCCRDG